MPPPQPPAVDYDHAPFIVIWEVTQACDLACAHCRAEAEELRDPNELTTDEGKALFDHLRQEFGQPLTVLTGGDPLKRPDLMELIRHGDAIGLRMAVTPSATPLLTEDAIRAMRDAGARRIAISIDGADAVTHDGFRKVPGTFARSIAALDTARRLGIETQVNSTIWRGNRRQLADLARLVGESGATLWSVFLLVPTGRAAREQCMDAEEHEAVYRELAELALDPATRYAIKTTAGQPYYRALAQLGAERGRRKGAKPAGLRAPSAVNDGKGFVFVSRTGDICPSGFLPLVCGNVREQRLADVYRGHPLFSALRTPAKLGGKCGVCPFNALCGGSRSRSWALTGDPLAADPTCAYVPPRALADMVR